MTIADIYAARARTLTTPALVATRAETRAHLRRVGRSDDLWLCAVEAELHRRRAAGLR